jgi:hypothetical protein
MKSGGPKLGTQHHMSDKTNPIIKITGIGKNRKVTYSDGTTLPINTVKDTQEYMDFQTSQKKLLEEKSQDNDEDISISAHEEGQRNDNNTNQKKITNENQKEKSDEESDQENNYDEEIPEFRTFMIKEVADTEINTIKAQIQKKVPNIAEHEIHYSKDMKTVYITTPFEAKKEQALNKLGTKIQKKIVNKNELQYVDDDKKVHYLGKTFASGSLTEEQLKKVIQATLVNELKDIQIVKIEKPKIGNWGFIICKSPKDAERIIEKRTGTTTMNKTRYTFEFDVCKPSKKTAEKTDKSTIVRNFDKQFEVMEIEQQLETIIVLINQTKQQQYIIDKINEKMNANNTNETHQYENMDIEEDKKPKTLKRKAEQIDKPNAQKRHNPNPKHADNDQQIPENYINQTNTTGQNTVNIRPTPINQGQINPSPFGNPPPTWQPIHTLGYGTQAYTMYGATNPYAQQNTYPNMYPHPNQYAMTNNYGQQNQTQTNNMTQAQLMQLMTQNPQIAMQLGFQRQQ